MCVITDMCVYGQISEGACVCEREGAWACERGGAWMCETHVR